MRSIYKLLLIAFFSLILYSCNSNKESNLYNEDSITVESNSQVEKNAFSYCSLPDSCLYNDDFYYFDYFYIKEKILIIGEGSWSHENLESYTFEKNNKLFIYIQNEIFRGLRKMYYCLAIDNGIVVHCTGEDYEQTLFVSNDFINDDNIQRISMSNGSFYYTSYQENSMLIDSLLVVNYKEIEFDEVFNKYGNRNYTVIKDIQIAYNIYHFPNCEIDTVVSSEPYYVEVYNEEIPQAYASPWYR